MQDEKTTISEQMRQHTEACKFGELNVGQYCKEKKIKPSTFYYWRKKLAADSKLNTGSFIQLLPISQSSCVEIIFTNGVKINFECLVPVDYLKQLIS